MSKNNPNDLQQKIKAVSDRLRNSSGSLSADEAKRLADELDQAVQISGTQTQQGTQGQDPNNPQRR